MKEKGCHVANLWDDIHLLILKQKKKLIIPPKNPKPFSNASLKPPPTKTISSPISSAVPAQLLPLPKSWGANGSAPTWQVRHSHHAQAPDRRAAADLKKKAKTSGLLRFSTSASTSAQHYIGVNMNLREEEQQKQLEQKEKDFIALILQAYKAEKVEGFKCFHGKKAGRLVSVGPVNLPVTRLFVEEIILECREKRISRVDILAFEFEMGLFPNIQEEAKAKGIDLALKYIPREVFDKRAVEKNQVVFHDVSYIEVKPLVKKGTALPWNSPIFPFTIRRTPSIMPPQTLKDRQKQDRRGKRPDH